MSLIEEEVAEVRKALERIYREDVTVVEVNRFLNMVRSRMANYAFAACIDSEVRKEAEEICQAESS